MLSSRVIDRLASSRRRCQQIFAEAGEYLRSSRSLFRDAAGAPIMSAECYGSQRRQMERLHWRKEAHEIDVNEIALADCCLKARSDVKDEPLSS